MTNLPGSFETGASAAQDKTMIGCGLVIAKFRAFLRTASSESDRIYFERLSTNILLSEEEEEEEFDKHLLRSEFNMENFLMWLTFCS
jgi:hypothetical protein